MFDSLLFLIKEANWRSGLPLEIGQWFYGFHQETKSLVENLVTWETLSLSKDIN